jgi:hypothetical protein
MQNADYLALFTSDILDIPNLGETEAYEAFKDCGRKPSGSRDYFHIKSLSLK